MTKKEMYSHIATINAEDAEVVAFCEHEIELLNKKRGSSKPSKTQIENEGYKLSILAVLEDNDRPMTVSDIMEDDRLKGLKNQKISALVTQLKNEGKIVRTTDKKKAYFSIAVD